jgi:cell division protein FtsL
MKRKQAVILQVVACLIALSACWFSYLEKQNELTELRLYAPKLAKEVREIREENAHLQYELQELQSPQKLLELAADPKFAHLRHPLGKNILVVEDTKDRSSSHTQFAAGAP